MSAKSVLEMLFAEFRNGHCKNIAILRSTTAMVSAAASLLLIWLIFRSRTRLTTTYHRLVLGMSIADILFSLGLAHFNVAVPIDISYMVWNARGNLASCNAIGFITSSGYICNVLYSVALNLYHLTVVKYNRTDRYIRKKIEPFLHGVPILLTLILCTTYLINGNINSNPFGTINNPFYDPPHCKGYEDGEVPDGFEIPCGRGRGGSLVSVCKFYILLFGAPIIIGTSLGLMYRDVAKTERRMLRYGAGALNRTGEPTESAAGAENNRTRSILRSAAFSVRSTITRRLSLDIGEEDSNTRGVLYRALAYSVAYLFTWTWQITSASLGMADKTPPYPLIYFSAFFTPLQGFMNLMIYMQPKVMAARRKGNLSWCQAFGKVICPTLEWVNKSTNNPPHKTPSLLNTASQKQSEIKEKEISPEQPLSDDIEEGKTKPEAHEDSMHQEVQMIEGKGINLEDGIVKTERDVGIMENESAGAGIMAVTTIGSGEFNDRGSHISIAVEEATVGNELLKESASPGSPKLAAAASQSTLDAL